MFSAQVTRINSDKFSRREEQRQMTDHEGSLDLTQKTDVAMKEHIEIVLRKDAVLRSTDYDEVDVHVINGVVHLNGHIMGAASQDRIEKAIRSIPGILVIKNNLILDDKLTLEVDMALGELERAYDCKFFTGTSRGVVSLEGVVSDEKVKLLAEQCVSANPNVRGVINNMRLSGVGVRSKGLPFVQPVIGETIYFLDGISGIVKRVIINPNNRRVTAMIVQGDFTDPQYKVNLLADGRTRLPDQLVTMPVSLIRYLTRVSGFLHIRSNERKRYMDFNPGMFFAPDGNWVPPFPYCPADILFPIEYKTGDMQVTPEPDQFPFGELLEEASIREQFFATDSFGL